MQRGKGQHTYYLPTNEGLRLYAEQASKPSNQAEDIAFALINEAREGRPSALDFSELGDRLDSKNKNILIKGLARAMRRRLIMSVHGLSDCEQVVAKYLLEEKDYSTPATQIYKGIGLKKSSLEGALDRLYKKRIVKRIGQSDNSGYFYKLNLSAARYALDRWRWLRAAGLDLEELNKLAHN